ncbi:MAG: DUF2935 domain-containing protein [Clostridia bacterium]|nr:DUF2935 domain-containing protein [Clostridia bacterium]
MQTDKYITKSLELHLFFGRIMKEHSLFLEAGFTGADKDCAKQAEFFKNEFEKLLCDAVMLSDGVVRQKVLDSGEIVTEFTCEAEKQTECFTGIAIDKAITEKELRLGGNSCQHMSREELCRQVKQLNTTALKLLDGLICFKESILNKVLCCEMFTMNYPLLIEHIIREAKLYREYAIILEKTCDLSDGVMKETECFWNQIMMEHAQFIRGLLDPTEKELFCVADGFANDYCELLKQCNCAHDKTLTAESLEETIKFRDFKRAGTKGIENCEIRSVILPLLADHVLREANHYIRLLENSKQNKC